MWRQRGWVSLLLSALVAAAAAGDPSSAAAPASPPAAATASPPAAANATVAPSAASAPPAADKPPSTAICQACVCDAASGLVDCSHKEMEDHFPDPADWKDLGFDPIEVRFDENMLVHVRPFAKLDKLKKLSMSHNHIAKIDDQAFQNLSSIEEIDLSHNHLTSEELSPHIFQGYYAPEQYEPLKKMRVLRLGSNALHSLHPDFFEHLPGLEELYLDSNPFKVIDRNTHSAITSIAYLKVLDLSRTSIGKLPEHFLHTPRYLEKLVLAGNMFPEPPEGLRDSHALLTLDMSENPFSVIRSVPAMANLTTLVISHCPDLTEIGQEALALLPALSRLYLHSNPRLVTIHPAALESPPEPPAETHVWPPVTTLDLHDNALGYLESTLVGRWDQMKEIRLDGNPWVCDCDNQWMIETLLPTLERMDPKFGVGLTCAAPEEMKHQSLRKLQASHYHMRCLDAYGNEPEHDTPILVGVLVGVLLAAPATLALVLLWRRLPGFKRRRAAGDYSRAFYKPAETEPDLF